VSAENDLYSIRYGTFVVPLTKAVQEQQALIEKNNLLLLELKKQMDELENQNKK